MANLKAHPGAPAPSNGVLTGAAPPGNPSVNRKKAKRRAKLAAKQQQQQQDDQQPPNPSLRNGNVPHAQRAVHNGHVSQPDPQHALEYDDELDDTEHFDAGDNEDLYYTDDEVTTYADRIWNTSTQEERERIREFWLSLGEEERKSLVKIEKEAVLRKMKEQQKHSCSCTVCGRKRTAIEEELEVLYDAYYEELELYDDQDKIPDNGDSVLTTGRPYSRRQDPRLPPDRMIDPNQPYDSGNRVEEIGDEEEDEDELDEEEYSDEDEEDYSDEEEPEELPVRGTAADFSFFGNSLTVKDDEEYDDEDEDYDSQEDEYEEEEDDLVRIHYLNYGEDF
ncbi:putative stress response protein nst1 [Diplodia seriata]|uniref:Stress response protein NST1 n=1 Tax=Diplodia seriata TaxID=420778 RepID=A0A0G2G011_9PEZI|nr:putative stress response protein nst1 [Diplodia seriata]